ncbi:MAG: EF-hand domain-containing protein [Micavibrio sp.]
MKKLMLGLGAAAIALTVSTIAEAREVKEIVGYVKTETVVNERDALFNEMDINGDGVVDFKEFQRASRFDNKYAMFKMNDTNNDDLLSLEEFRAFSKHGPARVSHEGKYGTHSNINNRPIQ